MCQNEGTHQIVMSFSPPVVGCLLKKAHKRGGHRHPRTPPGYAPGDWPGFAFKHFPCQTRGLLVAHITLMGITFAELISCNAESRD